MSRAPMLLKVGRTIETAVSFPLLYVLYSIHHLIALYHRATSMYRILFMCFLIRYPSILFDARILVYLHSQTAPLQK